MRKINHRDLELNIGQVCHCDDHLQIKVAGYYPLYNKITVASSRGDDLFFLAARDRKTDLSEAIPLSGRYVVIGGDCCSEDQNFKQCAVQNKADTWLNISDSLYVSRLLIAGAIRVIISCDDLNLPITETREFIQAKKDGRVIITGSIGE